MIAGPPRVEAALSGPLYPTGAADARRAAPPGPPAGPPGALTGAALGSMKAAWRGSPIPRGAARTRRTMANNANIPVNVPVDAAGVARIQRDERTWTGPKLVGLALAALGTALVVLHFMASTTAQISYPNPIMP